MSDDELVEGDNLQIIGETDPEELSESSTSAGKSDIPVRLLDDFTIYDRQSCEVLPVGVLMQLKYSSSSYCASGLVKAWVDDGEDEDEDDVVDVEEDDEQLDESGQRVQLSEILEFDVHHFSERQRKLDGYSFIAHVNHCRSEISGLVKSTYAQNSRGTFSILRRNHIFPSSLRSGFDIGFYI